MVERGILTFRGRLLTPRGRGLADDVDCSWLRGAGSLRQESGSDPGLRLIALFKFTKVALLIAVGLGALQLLDPETTIRLERWTSAVATSSDRRFVQHLLAHALGLTPGRLEVLALGAFLYSALFATEGVGLWLGLGWAEYLTAVATASFVPIELFEVFRHISFLRMGALGLNVAVAAYLVYRLRRAHTGKQQGPSAS
jgi:uncharacterized membrane protein (DUF2068 family)